MAFRRQTWIATIAFAALFGGGIRAAIDRQPDDLTAEWKPLWERCRQSIEVAEPLNVAGLSPVEVSKVVRNELVGSSDRSRLIGMKGHRFIIVEKESGPPNTTKRSCDVLPTPTTHVFSMQQIAMMVHSFIAEQTMPSFSETYKTPLIMPLYPYILLRSDAVNKNPNGCSTTATMFFYPRPETEYEAGTVFIRLTAAEQAIIPCSGPSRLAESGRARL